MADLPDVLEVFIADFARYIGPMRDARDATQDFARSVTEARKSLLAMPIAAEDAASGLIILDRELDRKVNALREFADGLLDARRGLTDVRIAALIDTGALRVLTDQANDAASAFKDLRTAAGGAAAAEGAAAAGGGLAGLFQGGGVVLYSTIAALAALVTGFLSIIPAAVAAGLGVAAFGAVALGSLHNVTSAAVKFGDQINVMNSQWNKIPAALRPAVESFMKLRDAWGAMGKALQPVVAPIITTLADIARKMLPFIEQFAKAAAPAIETLLKGLDKFVGSAGFKSFVDQMVKMTPGAILAIGHGIGQIAIAVGHLLLALAKNPQGVKDLAMLLGLVAGAINILARVITAATPVVNAIGHYFIGVAEALLGVHSATGKASGGVDSFLHMLSSSFTTMGTLLDLAAGAVGRFADRAVRWFEQLPGRILHALGDLLGLLVPGGRNLIQGLINGIGQMLGPLLNIINTVKNWLLNLIGLGNQASGAVSFPPPNGPTHPGGRSHLGPQAPQVVIINQVSGVVTDQHLIALGQVTRAAVNRSTLRNASTRLAVAGRIH